MNDFVMIAAFFALVIIPGIISVLEDEVPEYDAAPSEPAPAHAPPF